MKMNRLLLALAAVLAPLTVPTAAMAEGGIYVGTEGAKVAVGGYDTVSYFRGTGAPVTSSRRWSQSTKARPSRTARRLPIEVLPAPIGPTRTRCWRFCIAAC